MQYTALSRTQQCPPRATTPELPQDAPSRSALTDSRFTITDDRPRRLAPAGSDPSDAQHLRDVFYRMGFDDRAIVALSGAHALGRCHTTASGYDGPWSPTPRIFNNAYYTLLKR